MAYSSKYKNPKKYSKKSKYKNPKKYSKKSAVDILYPIFKKVEDKRGINSLDVYKKAIHSINNSKITKSIENKV